MLREHSGPLAFQFQEDKAADAATRLLRCHGGQMTRLHLIKLLYFAERKAAKLHNRPICGGHYVSMDNGPVLSEVYDLIKGERQGQVWGTRIESPSVSVHLIEDCRPSAVSEAELDVLDSICDKWAGRPLGEILDHAHQDLPEWQHPGGSSLPIEPAAFLRAVGKTEQDIREITEEVRAENYFHHLFT